MTQKGTVLVVDDDRLVLATLSHGLTQAGYLVIDADNGDDAILLARQHRPDLALLDIRMEGKSGFDVAAYLRQYCQIPFMFLSAFADEETVRQVKQLGAVAYLVKPLDIGQIVPAVEAAFANLPTSSVQPVQLVQPAQPRVPLADPAVAGERDGPKQPPVPAALTPSVAMAIGVLMHRYSLGRTAAAERLQRMASNDGRALAEQAERLLEAVEMLSVPGDL